MIKQRKKALILAGSRGIGKAIANSLKEIPWLKVDALSSKDLDTSNLEKCIELCDSYESVDVIVLNTGGPPAKPFSDITLDDWNKYHNQLFLGLALILQSTLLLILAELPSSQNLVVAVRVMAVRLHN